MPATGPPPHAMRNGPALRVRPPAVTRFWMANPEEIVTPPIRNPDTLPGTHWWTRSSDP